MLVRFNLVLYELLLPVFPPDSRRCFQESMVRTFEEQLESAWRETSAPGLVSVWMDVIRDLLNIALPYRITAAVVPFLTLLASTTLFSVMLWAIAPHQHCGR